MAIQLMIIKTLSFRNNFSLPQLSLCNFNAINFLPISLLSKFAIGSNGPILSSETMRK